MKIYRQREVEISLNLLYNKEKEFCKCKFYHEKSLFRGRIFPSFWFF